MKKQDNTECNIIFADLAENEKKYDCSTEEVLNKFKGILKTDTTTPFYKNEFDSTGNIFDSYKGGDTLKQQMQKETELYNKLIRQACTHRAVEGEFIIDSLKEFRTDLEYMVDVKNRENEYYVPDIYYEKLKDDKDIKTCLQDFCFGKTNCFRLTKVGEPIQEPKSVIFKSVFEYLKNSPLNLNSPLNFYDKLEVCLFGALNITSTNTPPPTNYVDINTVKSIIRGKNEFTFNNNPSIFDTFKRELDKTKNYASRIHSINSFFPEKYINDLLKLCYDDVFKKNSTSTTLTLAQIETFKGVFDAIDDENAKTAIGTLEFMNRVSKFNAVNSICFGKNDNATYEPLVKSDGKINPGRK
jgi:hypothetical protein